MNKTEIYMVAGLVLFMGFVLLVVSHSMTLPHFVIGHEYYIVLWAFGILAFVIGLLFWMWKKIR